MLKAFYIVGGALNLFVSGALFVFYSQGHTGAIFWMVGSLLAGIWGLWMAFKKSKNEEKNDA